MMKFFALLLKTDFKYNKKRVKQIQKILQKYINYGHLPEVLIAVRETLMDLKEPKKLITQDGIAYSTNDLKKLTIDDISKIAKSLKQFDDIQIFKETYDFNPFLFTMAYYSRLIAKIPPKVDEKQEKEVTIILELADAAKETLSTDSLLLFAGFLCTIATFKKVEEAIKEEKLHELKQIYNEIVEEDDE